MHDQRTALRPALGFENACDSGGIESVGAESVDGLGGERDQPSRADEAGGLGDERVGNGIVDSLQGILFP
jgi:hypothetical protein